MVTRGRCHGHYLRWHRTGEVRSEVPLSRPAQDTCLVVDCVRGAHSAGLCRSHDASRRRYGDPLLGVRSGLSRGPVRSAKGTGGFPCQKINDILSRPGAAPSSSTVSSWRHGWAVRSGTAQPKGQRLSDRLEPALALLARYDRDACAALGLDRDRATGAAATAEDPLPQDNGLSNRIW